MDAGRDRRLAVGHSAPLNDDEQLPNRAARPSTGQSRARVRGLLWRAGDGGTYATQLQLRIPGTRSNANIKAARRQVGKLVSPFQGELRRADPDARVVMVTDMLDGGVPIQHVQAAV